MIEVNSVQRSPIRQADRTWSVLPGRASAARGPVTLPRQQRCHRCHGCCVSVERAIGLPLTRWSVAETRPSISETAGQSILIALWLTDWFIDRSIDRLIELRFNTPLDRKWVIPKTLFAANLLSSIPRIIDSALTTQWNKRSVSVAWQRTGLQPLQPDDHATLDWLVVVASAPGKPK